jgi:hypothetical protein
MRKLILAVVLVCLPRFAAAQQPAKFQLSLEPSMAGAFLGTGNGLQIIAPERGGTTTAFGLGAEFGILVTPLLEPGVAMNLLIVSDNGTETLFGFDPFLKLNLWVAPHVNPFFQPFAGFLIDSPPGFNSATYFDGGLFTGVELLVTNWGFKIFTGFEALIGNGTHEIGIPIRWAFTVYF